MTKEFPNKMGNVELLIMVNSGQVGHQVKWDRKVYPAVDDQCNQQAIN